MPATTPLSTNKKVVYSILIIAFYLLGQFGGKYIYPYYSHLLADLPGAIRSIIWQVTYYGIVPLVGTLLIFGRQDFFGRLGLRGGFLKGLSMAFLMTLPMWLGYAWLSGGAININWGSDFWFGSVTAPIFEELFFRAFLFGLLYKFGGWKLVPATILDGLVFGAVHVGQGDSVGMAAGVFGVTAAGAVGFSILYKEWGWNLWLVIFLHAFMNLSWMTFDVADNAAGGVWANVFRVATVVLAVVLTKRRMKRAKQENDFWGENDLKYPAASYVI